MTKRTKAERRRVSAKRYDGDCWRLHDEADKLIGWALRLTNGRWSLNDTNDNRLSKATFDKPSDVAAAMGRRLDQQTDTDDGLIILRE